MKRLLKFAGDTYHNAREIVDKNYRLIKKKKLDDCKTFSWNGYKIFDPFKDETGDKDADPVEYYGKAYEQSDFNK